MAMALLEIRNLHTYFYTDSGVARAVDGVSFSIEREQSVALVGESGCGKSVTALSIMRLVDDPPGRIVEGEIIFDGENLLTVPESRMREVRGAEIGMIFQEPMTSLNPVFSVGRQITECIRVHENVSKEAARRRAVDMLRKVGIPNPEVRVNQYPHQMSGGMKQRVMIAMSSCCNPIFGIADEPTTALDVTIQAQILDLMKSMRKKTGFTDLFITHDLAVVAEYADVVNVMYAGKIVERAVTGRVFSAPTHPYTVGLLSSAPRLVEDRDRLPTIPGAVPSPTHWPRGCRFHPRCSRATAECRREIPPFEEHAPDHFAACYHPFQVRAAGLHVEE